MAPLKNKKNTWIPVAIAGAVAIFGTSAAAVQSKREREAAERIRLAEIEAEKRRAANASNFNNSVIPAILIIFIVILAIVIFVKIRKKQK